MAETAERLLKLLPDQRKALRVPFDKTARRHRWSYTPREHPGVALSAMSLAARAEAMRLLSTALSPLGYAKAVAVMSLEEVLDRQERWLKGRHMQNYWVAVYGTPGEVPWGWRFEGHHISVNLTITDQGISATPLFLGAHPATVEGATGPILAPLGDEDALGLAVVRALPEALAREARTAKDAPWDIHSGSSPQFTELIQPPGLAVDRMPPPAGGMLARLVDAYDSIVEPAVLAAEPVARPGVEELSFAWQGDAGGAGPRYYRVQGPGLLIEHNFTQGVAGHVHTVRRVPGHDFGS